MKNVLLAVVFAVSFLFMQGQTTGGGTVQGSSGKSLELIMGYSLPLGVYAKTDINEDKSGYATGGWHIQAAFSWIGSHDLGLGIQYTYQRSGTDNPASNIYPYGMPDSLDPKSWSNNYLLAGPVYQTKLGRLLIDARVLGGLVICASPVFDTPEPGDSLNQSYNTNVATGFALEAAVGVGYYVAPGLAVKLNLSILGGWPGKTRSYPAQFLGYEQYKDPITGLVYMKPVYSAPMEFEMHKVITTFNPSLGLVYRF
jgi:hypothetical protein